MRHEIIKGALGGIYTYETLKADGVVTIRIKDFGGSIIEEGTGDTAHAASEDIQERTQNEGLFSNTSFIEPF